MTTTADLQILIEAKDQASKVVDEFQTKVGGLGKTLGDVGKLAGGFLAANVIAGAGEKVLGFVGDSLKAASDLQQSVGGVEAVFGESSKEILAWGKNAATQAGLSRNAFNELAVPLGAGLKNAGLSMSDVTAKTLDLTQRAADMAATFGGPVEDALGAITAGLRGEADPLERYGVGLSAAKVEAHALAMTGKDVASSLTDQEKTLARVDLIMKQTTDSTGKFASESDTAAGKAAIEAAKYENLQATLGTKLLPIQTAITEAKIKLIDFLVTKAIPTLEDLYNKHWPSVQRVLEKLKPIVELMVKDVLQRVQGMIDGFEAVGKVVGDVVDLIEAIASGDWSRAWEELKSIALGIVDALKAQVKVIFGSIPEILLGLVGQFFDAAFSLGDAIMRGIRDALSSAVGFAGDVAGAVLQAIKSVVNDQVIDRINRGLEFEVDLGIKTFKVNPPDIPRLKTGMPYVPNDFFPAFLDRGERVLTAEENRRYSSGAIGVPTAQPMQLHVHLENHGTIIGIDNAEQWVGQAVVNLRRRGSLYGIV